jgi:hypothetical protein
VKLCVLCCTAIPNKKFKSRNKTADAKNGRQQTDKKKISCWIVNFKFTILAST